MKLLTLPLAITALATAAAAPPTVDADNFAALHAVMQATEAETKWQQIPWHADLWSARAAAAETGKPIYLWEMDGHPLGCT